METCERLFCYVALAALMIVVGNERTKTAAIEKRLRAIELQTRAVALTTGTAQNEPAITKEGAHGDHRE